MSSETDYTKHAKTAEDKLLYLFETNDDSVWTFIQEKEGVTLERNNEETGNVSMFRLVGQMKADKGHIATQVLWDKENAKKLSSTLTDVEVVEKLSNEMEIQYHSHGNMPWGVTKRDFVFVRSRRQLDNGNYVIASMSVTHQDRPPRKDHVRGDFFSGYLVQDNGDGTCQVSYIIRMDLKGSIPSFVMNLGNNKLLQKFISLRSYAEN
eukprot:gb/GECH01006186.1/.p1 GENE.gb/GECH01006186.1/~~gb/GECH01006186.1/.p1  ORF type:complete len:208 (+),score=33.01 gb/GECH01006186.1/:1-624(+)